MIRRRVGRSFTAIAAVILLLAGAPAAAIDDSRPAPLLSLLDQTFALPVGGTWRASYELIGDPGTEILTMILEGPTVLVNEPGSRTLVEMIQPLEDYEVVLTSYVPIERRDQIPEVLAGILGNALDGARLPLRPMLRISEHGTVIIDLEVQTAVDGNRASELEFPVAGIYPVTMDIQRRGELVARHLTFVERLDATETSATPTRPLRLAVVAGVADPGPLPTNAELFGIRSGLLEIIELAEATGVPITVELPPSAATVLDRDPALRDRLNTAIAGNEMISMPSIALDPSSMVEAGEVEAYTRLLRSGENAFGERLDGVALRRSARLHRSAFSLDGAAMLRDLGTQLIVVPEELYQRLRNQPNETVADSTLVSPILLPDGSQMNLAVVDPVSRLLTPEEAGVRTPAERAVLLLTELSVGRPPAADTNRMAVLSTAELGRPDADVIVALEPLVANHPRFEFEQLSFVSNTTDVVTIGGEPLVIELPERAGPSIVQRSERIAGERLRSATIGSMLPDDDPRLGRWNDELDRLLSTGFSESLVTERLAMLDRELNAVPGAIELPDPFTFTLTGKSSEVGLRIINTAETDLSVILVPRSSKLAFPLGDMDLTLAPGLNAIDIPVETRSNGTFPVEISLRTPVGEVPIAEPLELTARVNAVTGLGQVISVGALLVLGTWWFSHLRTRRRKRLDQPADDPSEMVAAP